VVKWGYLTRFSDYRIIRRVQVHDLEASFKRGKGEAGMDEYQVRTVRRESTIEECGNTIGYTGIR